MKATSDFYQCESASFSATRQGSWEGWRKLLEHLDPNAQAISVLDLGCGNLRFERFLQESLPHTKITAYAFDNCEDLTRSHVPQNVDIRFNNLDVMAALENKTLGRDLGSVPPCDLVVAFGLAHHIPFHAWRTGLLATMLQKTSPKGMAAMSFWQFLKSKRIAAQAKKITEQGAEALGIELDTARGEYLLGWQGKPGVYRYCHNFTDTEVANIADQAAQSAHAHLGKGQAGNSAEAFSALCYSADGSEGNLNRYVVLKRNID